MNRRSILVAGLAGLAFVRGAAALAQIPPAPNCSVEQPPADAGAAAMPGGFLLVYPRNGGLSDGYTGCKVLWVVDTPDRFIRLMTLYFERGKLRIAQAYDRSGASRGTCTVPSQARECEGVESNPLAALKMPTWPRRCITQPDAPQCTKEPD